MRSPFRPVATLATLVGLLAGGAASAAPAVASDAPPTTADAAPAAVPDDGLVRFFGSYGAKEVALVGTSVAAFPTLAEARDAATPYEAREIETTELGRPIYLLQDPSGACLTTFSSPRRLSAQKCIAQPPSVQKWTIGQHGQWVSLAGLYVKPWNAPITNPPAAKTDEVPTESWTEASSSFDLGARTTFHSAVLRELHLVGTAPVGTKDVLLRWTEGEGDEAVEREAHGAVQSSDGAWTARLEDVPLGTTAVTLQALTSVGTPFAERATTVSLEYAPLKAVPHWSVDLDDRAVLEVRGEPGATVEVRRGTELLGSVVLPDDAAGYVDVPAPDAAGEDTLDLRQVDAGVEHGSIRRTLFYGDGVVLDAPADGATTGSAVTLGGTGEKGARVSVHDAAAPSVELATGAVDPESGRFSVTTPDLADGDHTLVVVQTGRGANHTSAEVDVTVDATVTPPVVEEFAVTTPTDGSEHRGELVEFTGDGAAGSTVTLHTSNFTSTDVTTTVAGDGHWSVRRWIGDGPYTFDITQTTAGQPDGTATLRINVPAAPVEKEFAVTAPASGSEHRGELVEFTGTGTPDSTITLHATNITSPDVTTTVDKNGYWSVKRWIGDGPYSFDVIQTSTENTETGRLSDLRINQSADVVRDFAVTTPTDGSEHRGELVEFTGDGTPMSTITLHTSNFTSTDVTTTVDKNGHWSLERWIGNGPYTVDITQTTNGDPNGTTTLHLNAPTH